jgi:hypothetical protein
VDQLPVKHVLALYSALAARCTDIVAVLIFTVSLRKAARLVMVIARLLLLFLVAPLLHPHLPLRSR